jgi:hypothetical protein
MTALLTSSFSAFSATEFQGKLQSVSVTDAAGTNTPPTAKFTYTKDGNVFTFDASSSFDLDGNITKYEWNFGDGIKAEDESLIQIHNYSSGTYNVTLTAVDNNGGVSITQQSISTNLTVNINFQPSNVDVPIGFLPDSLENFDIQKGYGWIANVNNGARIRNNALSPDKTYDTLVLPYANAVWEYSVPNGSYEVIVCIGDPSYPTTTNYVQVEGVTVYEATKLDVANRWYEKTVQITITDARLTLTFTNSPNLVSLAWIKIRQQ